MKAAVITVSDRCSAGEAEDKSGPTIVALLQQPSSSQFKDAHVHSLSLSALQRCTASGAASSDPYVHPSPTAMILTCIVPDEKDKIQSVVKAFVEVYKVNLVVTTGGTGFSVRDVTPEAIKPLLEREAPGIVHAMMANSFSKTPYAWLSRPVAGTIQQALVITVPGSEKAVVECLTPIIENGLEHALKLMKGHARDPHPGEGTTANSRHQTDPTNTVSVTGGGCSCCDSGKEKKSVADRPRESPFEMVSMERSRELIDANTPSKDQFLEKKVSLEEAVGNILASDVVSAVNHPPFRASVKDGYAVVSSDGPGVYEVVGSLLAGHKGKMEPLVAGKICRVNTGGPLPEGADAVVQVEDTKLVERDDANGEEKKVEICIPVPSGYDVRPIGCDIKAGHVVLRKGTLISAPEVGLLHTTGVRFVSIYWKPIVAVMSTGNELCDMNSVREGDSGDSRVKPSEGKIFDSNRPMLLCALKSLGFHVIDCGIASDNIASTRETLYRALEHADYVLSTGGVSMGEADCLKKVLQEMGATIHFGRVSMKPGKPTTFATIENGRNGKQKTFFALPGNPVSAMVSFYVFALPSLHQASGQANPALPVVTAELVGTVPLKLDPERVEFHRCEVSWSIEKGCLVAESTGMQHSHRLLSMAGANGLIEVPIASEVQKELNPGEHVQVHLFKTLQVSEGETVMC